MVGDSVSLGVGVAMATRPWVSSVGNSGFSPNAQTRIIDNTLTKINLHGAPDAVLVMAGVVDIARGRTAADTIVYMQDYETDMNDLGVDVVWFAEPGWTWQDAGLDDIATWINSRPNSVDCRGQAGPTMDGVHPMDYTAISQCTANGVTALGLTWEHILNP